MAIGDEEPPRIDILNWHDLYNHIDNDEQPVIYGLAYRGRWTAIAAPAKAGKSTIILALAVEAAHNGMTILYMDAEMGRVDVLERVEEWMNLTPNELTNLHYTDLPPKLDNVQGATALWNTVTKLDPDLVIIDGLNGVVNGAENDDTPWRDMYEWAIMPLKQRGTAVITLDNAGHGQRKGPRGSSVKLDKPDAIIVIERTDNGAKLTCTHRRSASYPLEQEYTVSDAEPGDPPMQVRRVDAGTGCPPGTKQIVAILDELDVPLEAGKRTVRRLLKNHGHDCPRDLDLLAMLAWRRRNVDMMALTGTLVPMVPPVPGTTGNQASGVVPNSGTTPTKPQRNAVVPAGGDVGTPTSGPGSQNTGATTPVENPF